ncbi:MAG TPA: SDR family oxidoreductase [Gaiellales bacterium]|jgi:NAD(P)-dependent dehydrogenase (short-subunit alcohol dehydrogenase family)
MTQLSGTRIVILGGTSGIGLATALRASAAGADVVVVSANPERVDAALEQLPEGADGYAVDLRDEQAVAGLFERLGELDHLVYTAGEALQIALLADTDLDAGRRAFETRYWGAYAAAKHAAPRLREGGSITLSSGGAGERPMASWSVASSICGAIESLTRALAIELAPIRVNAVAPGLVRSNLWSGTLSAQDEQGLYVSMAAALPVGRVGEVDDVADTLVYLMGNGYTTGSIVPVNGGGLLV